MENRLRGYLTTKLDGEKAVTFELEFYGYDILDAGILQINHANGETRLYPQGVWKRFKMRAIEK